ncbi:MAG: GIY-YIG nuclease family protein [Planctomycetota bacterium]
MKRLPRFYVYLLIAREDGTIYTGYTANLRRRFKRHNRREKGRFTSGRRWHLLAVKCFLDKHSALLFERRLKRWYHGRGNWTRDAWISQSRPRLRRLETRYGIARR